MIVIKQNNQIDVQELANKAKELVQESRMLNFAKMATILIELFGFDNAFTRIKKREGQEVGMYFPSVDGNLTFTLVNDRNKFECRPEKSKNPAATIIFNLPRDKDIKVVNNIIKSKDNLFGLAKMLPNLLFRKIKIKGSLIAAITLCRAMMIGKHPMYQRKSELRY